MSHLSQQKHNQQQHKHPLSTKHKMANLQLPFAFILILIWTNLDAALASQDLLPDICDTYKCPPYSDIICPEDSDLIQNLQPIASALLQPMGADTTSTQAPSSPPVAQHQQSVTYFNATSIEFDEDLYAQCCLSQKCHCRTCYIPDCKNEYEIIVELVPESPRMPGQCCGQYECQKKPNCSEVRDTEHYWLADCKRCKCHSGEPICHQSCDEGMRKPTAICKSKALNQYFEHGQTWKVGCTECECVYGEEKCIMSFCRSVNCPKHRQVLTKDGCCPVCWPKDIPMPYGDDDYDDEDGKDEQTAGGASGVGSDAGMDDSNYEDEDDQQSTVPHKPQPTDSSDSTGNDSMTLLPDISFRKEEPKETATGTVNAATSESTSLTKTVTATEAIPMENSPTAASTTKPPCSADMSNKSDSYTIYPGVVEVVRPTEQSYFLYITIGVLALIIIVLVALIVHMRHKQRSYRPVSNFDDNFNKMSSNIKKMNDYV